MRRQLISLIVSRCAVAGAAAGAACGSLLALIIIGSVVAQGFGEPYTPISVLGALFFMGWSAASGLSTGLGCGLLNALILVPIALAFPNPIRLRILYCGLSSVLPAAASAAGGVAWYLGPFTNFGRQALGWDVWMAGLLPGVAAFAAGLWVSIGVVRAAREWCPAP